MMLSLTDLDPAQKAMAGVMPSGKVMIEMGENRETLSMPCQWLQ
jgi:hypothetical protein